MNKIVWWNMTILMLPYFFYVSYGRYQLSAIVKIFTHSLILMFPSASFLLFLAISSKCPHQNLSFKLCTLSQIYESNEVKINRWKLNLFHLSLCCCSTSLTTISHLISPSHISNSTLSQACRLMKSSENILTIKSEKAREEMRWRAKAKYNE